MVAREVLEFGEAQLFHERRDVHGEASAQTHFQPGAAAHRIVRRATPKLDRAGGRFNPAED